eukprot:CAMPEP_0115861070 /NCGR_PEP_ID=MMETSP0287-20121206/17462_1 /TAXON_ID=412157 /ORGANISM="Chrysochromulina rotalis, Strain UIO044" /LENGTH=116 /DNA_ID=CAMNT_0003315431 /DNA_START=196 /DNA_END=543 /DNA_ORIENTATION=+
MQVGSSSQDSEAVSDRANTDISEILSCQQPKCTAINVILAKVGHVRGEGAIARAEPFDTSSTLQRASGESLGASTPASDPRGDVARDPCAAGALAATALREAQLALNRSDEPREGA